MSQQVDAILTQIERLDDEDRLLLQGHEHRRPQDAPQVERLPVAAPAEVRLRCSAGGRRGSSARAI